MVTHWESSRRPLYVRTIWKDGQHHVILDKTKETSQVTVTSRRSKQCPSSQGSHRAAKSACAQVNLKISSVRVLISGINGFKKRQFTETLIDRPKTWTQPALNQPIPCKNLNKEVTFNTIQVKPSDLNKSNTIDSDSTEMQSADKFRAKMVLNDALSERVMIWLDLATHNNCQVEKGIEENMSIESQVCSVVPKVEKQFENIPLETSILRMTPRQDYKKKENILVYSSEEIEMPEDNFHHVLTPTTSNNNDCTRESESTKDPNRIKMNNVKRQLHIFMPNLRNKSSDCASSIISSKISVH